MKEPILHAILLFIGFNAMAQSNSSSAGQLKHAIEAMLPEGEVTADIMEDGGKLSFSIASNGEQIWFYTYAAPQPAYSILDKVSIDLTKNTVTIDSVELAYTGEVGHADYEGGLKNNWQGHRWHAEQPVGPCMRSYGLTIGRLERTGQTFLHIQIPSLELPLLF